MPTCRIWICPSKSKTQEYAECSRPKKAKSKQKNAHATWLMGHNSEYRDLACVRDFLFRPNKS